MTAWRASRRLRRALVTRDCYVRSGPRSNQGSCSNGSSALVAITLTLVGSTWVHAQIFGLHIGQLRQLRTECIEVQSRDLFIKPFRQHIDAERIAL